MIGEVNIGRLLRFSVRCMVAWCVCCCASQCASASESAPALTKGEMIKVSFTPTDSIFPNPERGLFHHLQFRASTNNFLTDEYIAGCRNNGITLLYTAYILDSHRDGSPISPAFLTRIRGNMEALRRGGMKGVVRFCYSMAETEKPWDIPLDATLAHIAQIKPLLQEYADVVAVLEAGFIGAWGEWYYTDNYTFQPRLSDYANRRKVVEALLDALPSTRCVSLRYPEAKLGVLQVAVKDSLTGKDAHSGSARSRLGFHNDCFLANSDDMGTYGGNQEYRKYVRNESRFTPMGGETCADYNSYSEEENARQAFADYHWSYLNEDYHPGTISEWRDSGFFAEVARRLGYRFVLVDGELPVSATRGGEMMVTLRIRNEGWSAPFNPRGAELVAVSAKSPKDRYTFPLKTDPRSWAPGAVTEIAESVSLPKGMPTGEYTLYLNLPDPSLTLKARPEFSIRLANADVWTPTLGYNRLGTLTVN